MTDKRWKDVHMSSHSKKQLPRNVGIPPVPLTEEAPIVENVPLFNRIELAGDWKRILQRAWSIRLMVLAAMLSGTEALLPFAQALGWVEWMPGGVFAIASFFVVSSAFAARLVAQSNLEPYRRRRKNVKRKAKRK